jgi:hypothetical protein
VYGAGSAQRHPAAELRSSHADHVSKDPKQGHVGGDVQLMSGSIYLKRDHREFLLLFERGKPLRVVTMVIGGPWPAPTVCVALDRARELRAPVVRPPPSGRGTDRFLVYETPGDTEIQAGGIESA